MKNYYNLKRINWTIFPILLFLGVDALVPSLYGLYSTAHITNEGQVQSHTEVSVEVNSYSHCNIHTFTFFFFSFGLGKIRDKKWVNEANETKKN